MEATELQDALFASDLAKKTVERAHTNEKINDVKSMRCFRRVMRKQRRRKRNLNFRIDVDGAGMCSS